MSSRPILVISKADAKAKKPMAQVALGAVYMPEVVDSQGDYMTADEIQKMAFDFMRTGDLGCVDVMHDNKRVGARVVESFISRKGDPDFPVEGTWVVGIEIPNKELWERVVKGELGGFSMEVHSNHRPGVIEKAAEGMTLPGSIIGRTMKAGDDDNEHTHSYEIEYGADGKVVGGRTSVHRDANGNTHSHIIKGGVITEEADGHRHRYSTVEHLLGKR